MHVYIFASFESERRINCDLWYWVIIEKDSTF